MWIDLLKRKLDLDWIGSPGQAVPFGLTGLAADRWMLLGDYHRPTGQPRRADEYARVEFSDEGKKLEMAFTPAGRPGEATIMHHETERR